MARWTPALGRRLRALVRHAVLRRTVGALALLCVVDVALTPILFLSPETLLPFLHPALTWPGLFAWLLGGTPGIRLPRWPILALRLLEDRPWPGWALTQIPFAVVGLWVLIRAVRGGPGGGVPRTARVATHGSARWRRPAEFGSTLGRTGCDRPDQAGVVVGADGRCATVTRPAIGNPHVLLIGATRAGKSRRVILPTVWTLGHAGQSMVLSDPKGELHATAASWLRSRGYEVVLIDLLRPARGNRWNPLAGVRRAHDACDGEEASRLAWDLGNTLAWADQGAGSDPIWPQAAESTIAALALGAALEAPPGARHPATMYRILADLGGDGAGGASLDAWFRSLPPDHPARQAYGTAALSESRTRSSIFTGVAANLRIFADPGVAWLTATSDHDPADAGRRPTAIFLLLPDESAARRPVLTLYVAQAYAALATVARDHGGALANPVWFLLDEFGNIGRLPGIAEKLTVSAGRGIRFLLAVQSLAQIDHIYSPRVREVVTGNCDTCLYLRAADEATPRAISAQAGIQTVLTRSVQHRPGWLAGPSGGSDSATGRPLLYPDEVLRWPLGDALVLQAGQFPARLGLCDLSGWAAASQAFVPRPPARPVPATAPETWVPDQDTDTASADAEPARHLAARPGLRRSTFGGPRRGGEARG